ncbi:MAG: hypothetical protein GDA40_12160 [Rhodobacteraceae bacterium]|nr:hypothetical protein [Paracoccaceae bacterium]
MGRYLPSESPQGNGFAYRHAKGALPLCLRKFFKACAGSLAAASRGGAWAALLVGVFSLAAFALAALTGSAQAQSPENRRISLTQFGSPIISPPLLVSEGQPATTYNVALTSAPDADVTVTLSLGSESAIRLLDGDSRVSTLSLVFRPEDEDWDTGRTVSVEAVDDDIAHASPRSATITHSAMGGGYDGTSESLDFTVGDDESEGLNLNDEDVEAGLDAVEPVSVNEGEDQIYSVALTSQPSGGSVVVTLRTADPTIARLVDVDDNNALVNTLTLTFRADNNDWQDGLPVTVRGIRDNVDSDEARFTSIGHTSSGPGYSQTHERAIRVIVQDTDTRGIVLTAASLSLAEGGSDTYTIALGSSPPSGEEVVVTLQVGDDTGGGYGNPEAVVLAVSVRDNDTRGIVLSQMSLTLAEGGAASYNVSLNSRPAEAVTLSLVSETEGPLAFPASVTIEPENWDTGESVTISAPEDDVVYGDIAIIITHSATSEGYTTAAQNVTINFNDNARKSIALTATSLSLDEGGSGTYTIALGSSPPSGEEVVVTLQVGDDTVATLELSLGDPAGSESLGGG